MAAAHDFEGSTQQHRSALYSVLSLTKYIPYPSITHAGGQYVLAHDRALEGFAEVENLAPDIPLNREALPRVVAGPAGSPPAALIDGAHLAGLSLALWRLESVWAGSSIYRPIRRLFQGPHAPWAKLEAADVVELQWSEMVALAPSIKRRLPNTPLIGIAHDVITQRLDRQAASARPGLRKALLRLAAHRARKREARSFGAVDLLIVFSEKDAVLARELAPGTRVEVVHPGLQTSDALPRAPHHTEPVVLFTGAMNRPENWRGAMWFLDEMWPTVLREAPEARLVVAGANPPEMLGERIAAAPRASLTGFVDSLEPFYAEASVFIAALQSGAGVKFKTIDAMLRGVPIVATSVGVEGIDAPELFAAVTDDPSEFAAAVVEQLRAPNEQLTEKAKQWAENVYGTAAFERRVRELYVDVIER